MDMMGFMNKYWKQITGYGLDAEQRVFAVLEAVCKPVSFLALGGVPVFGLLRWNGLELPDVLVDYVIYSSMSVLIPNS